MAQLKEVDSRVAVVEAWAKACDDGEAAVKRGREALAAGNRDEAAGHCRQARALLDGGMKCESLAREVKDLEQALNAGIVLNLAVPCPCFFALCFGTFWPVFQSGGCIL
jgi:hypothetical protein